MDERKQKQKLEQAKLEPEQSGRECDSKGVVSAMVLPDYRSGRNEWNVQQVRNVSLFCCLDNRCSLLHVSEL
jgi:hypothetical protein